MGTLGRDQLQLGLRELAVITGSLATYLDRSEHLEPPARDMVPDAGRRLRDVALDFAFELGVDVIAAYAERLKQLELRNVINAPATVDPPGLVLSATTWRDLQAAQVEHDRWFHPDVFGMPRWDQLRHFVLHLAKLTAFVAQLDEHGDWFDFVDRRLPDMLVFGVKLPTTAGVRLSEDPLPNHALFADAGHG
jgi:hypothetical protein